MIITLIFYAMTLTFISIYFKKIANAPSYTLRQSMVSDFKRFDMVIVALVMLYIATTISITVR